jgi:hypothetical protein
MQPARRFRGASAAKRARPPGPLSRAPPAGAPAKLAKRGGGAEGGGAG